MINEELRVHYNLDRQMQFKGIETNSIYDPAKIFLELASNKRHIKILCDNVIVNENARHGNTLYPKLSNHIQGLIIVITKLEDTGANTIAMKNTPDYKY